MDKFVVKLKRFSFSDERDQGDSLEKLFLTTIRIVLVYRLTTTTNYW